MIEFKKIELESALLTILVYSAPKEGEQQRIVGGLLNENLLLSAKRGLQKIHKKLIEAYQELTKDIEELRKECGEDKEKLEKELKELFNETVKIDAESIKISAIEDISTTANYNFDIIEKIAI